MGTILKSFSCDPLATSKIVQPESSVPFDDSTLSDLSMYVTGMDIRVRLWDSRPVIGAMKIYYNTGGAVVTVEHGKMNPVGPDDEVHHFDLKDGDRIICATIRAGVLIDSMTFVTNTGHTFGPYGGDGGRSHEIKCEKGSGEAYLSSFKGRVDGTQDDTAVRLLQLNWVYNESQSDLADPGQLVNLWSKKPLNLHLIGRLDVNYPVDGVEHFDGKIFTIKGGQKTIEVFKDEFPFELVDSIQVDVGDMSSIVACRELGRLYLADLFVCVWVMDLKLNDTTFRKWIPNELAPDKVCPNRLSVRDTQLLVTDTNQNQLALYTADGRLEGTIRLKQLADEVPWDPIDACETPHDTVIVSYHIDKEEFITEIDYNGDKLRQFLPVNYIDQLVPNHQLSWVSNVVLVETNDGFLIVASDRNNRRVLLLNDKFQLEKVILGDDCKDCKEAGGTRLARPGPKDGQLMVCLAKGVAVFAVKSD